MSHTPYRPIKVVVVGDGAVGKTCILVSYVTNCFPHEYIPTVFDNYSTNLRVYNHAINLGLWDTSGQDTYDRLRPLSYPETDVFLFCFAIDSRDSLENVVSKWNPECTHYCNTANKILVGTKADLRRSARVSVRSSHENKALVTYEEGRRVAKELGAIDYMECSAQEHKGLSDIFEEANKSVLYPQQTKKATKKKRRKKQCTVI